MWRSVGGLTRACAEGGIRGGTPRGVTISLGNQTIAWRLMPGRSSAASAQMRGRRTIERSQANRTLRSTRRLSVRNRRSDRPHPVSTSRRHRTTRRQRSCSDRKVICRRHRARCRKARRCLNRFRTSLSPAARVARRKHHLESRRAPRGTRRAELRPTRRTRRTRRRASTLRRISRTPACASISTR